MFSFMLIGFCNSLIAQSQHLYQYKKMDGFNSQDKIDKEDNSKSENKDKDTNKTSVPFDGGLSLLVAAGAGIAAKKRYDKKKAAV